MKKIILISIIFIVILLGCTKDSPLSPENDLIVIRGYLYAGEPVTDIRITSTLPLGSEETKAPPVNDAQVAMVKEDKKYDLVLSPGDSGYYHYEGDDLLIAEGEQYTLKVRYHNQEAYASTMVPQAPKNVAISRNTLIYPSWDTLWELRQQGVSMDSIREAMTVSVTWEKEDDALYYVVVDNIDENPIEIETQFRGGPRRFISRPVSTDEYLVNAMMMTHLGKHEVRVYRVNQEYADLYQSRNQDSRDLNEPLTNVVNGLGVFSAFNSQNVFFEFAQ